jgi:hypothetical protein
MWQYYRRAKNSVILSLPLDDSELSQNTSMNKKYVKFWTLGHGKETSEELTCSECEFEVTFNKREVGEIRIFHGGE